MAGSEDDEPMPTWAFEVRLLSYRGFFKPGTKAGSHSCPNSPSTDVLLSVASAVSRGLAFFLLEDAAVAESRTGNLVDIISNFEFPLDIYSRK